MTTSVKMLLESAHESVPRITPAEAMTRIAAGNAVVIDVRDGTEVAKTGMIDGALNVSRGMLEFRADPQSPYHEKAFDKTRTVILYCASGGRSALGGKALKELGYESVYNLGAFKDWIEAGGKVQALSS